MEMKGGNYILEVTNEEEMVVYKFQQFRQNHKTLLKV
jgi:hypothetical protein